MNAGNRGHDPVMATSVSKHLKRASYTRIYYNRTVTEMKANKFCRIYGLLLRSHCASSSYPWRRYKLITLEEDSGEEGPSRSRYGHG
ncbi:hypothetical protein AKJ16_DCAP23980 [Drosera capensis]